VSQGRYATKTEVPAERSRAEIERLLVRYGATGFMYAWEGESQVIAFKIHDRYIRIMLPMPDPADFQLTEETRRRRSADAQQRAYDQAVRQRGSRDPDYKARQHELRERMRKLNRRGESE